MSKVAWGSLNSRQQAYMRIIYLTDQIQEYNAKSLMRLEMRSIPADRWRWIEYADLYVGCTPFKKRLLEARLVDQGTGSTFEALRDRGLILINYHGSVWVRMTTQGRGLVRRQVRMESEE